MSQPLDINACIVRGVPEQEDDVFEPSIFVNKIFPGGITDDANLVVIISDFTAKVEFRLPVFLRKSYVVKSGMIRFGSIKFKLSNTFIFIGRKYNVTVPESIVPEDIN